MQCFSDRLFEKVNVFFPLDPKDPSLPLGIPKPTLTRYIKSYNIYVGANLTLLVNVSGNPPPKITWFKDQYLLDRSNSRLTVLRNNSLRLTNVQVKDVGRYDYMAENDKGQIFATAWVVFVKCK